MPVGLKFCHSHILKPLFFRCLKQIYFDGPNRTYPAGRGTPPVADCRRLQIVCNLAGVTTGKIGHQRISRMLQGLQNVRLGIPEMPRVSYLRPYIINGIRWELVYKCSPLSCMLFLLQSDVKMRPINGACLDVKVTPRKLNAVLIRLISHKVSNDCYCCMHLND